MSEGSEREKIGCVQERHICVDTEDRIRLSYMTEWIYRMSWGECARLQENVP
jgi:hypothetical protein